MAARVFPLALFLQPAELFPVAQGALVAAAQVHMKRLDNRFEAARLYKHAQASPLPHRDWETTIRQGLAQAQA